MLNFHLFPSTAFFLPPSPGLCWHSTVQSRTLKVHNACFCSTSLSEQNGSVEQTVTVCTSTVWSQNFKILLELSLQAETRDQNVNANLCRTDGLRMYKDEGKKNKQATSTSPHILHLGLNVNTIQSLSKESRWRWEFLQVDRGSEFKIDPL